MSAARNAASAEPAGPTELRAATTAAASTRPAARPRAAALPPEERRAAIVEATVPLLLEHGAGVTTRQIAEAAGIAEGTIFRVFPDKESLIEATVATAFDPEPVEEALRAIDLDVPLEQRLVQAVDVLRRRLTTIWQLMTAAGLTQVPDEHRGPPNLAALAALFEPERDQLRREPLAAAQLLRGLTFAGSHPALIADEALPSAEIVSVLLDGIRARPDTPEQPAPAPPARRGAGPKARTSKAPTPRRR